MGWLYMQSLGGHSGPRQYLDAQFTFARPRPDVQGAAVRASRACASTTRPSSMFVTRRDKRTVFAAVCLVRYNPRDREGYIFGYKDMDETVGPNESDCPEAILDLLTQTEYPLCAGLARPLSGECSGTTRVVE